MPSPSTNDLGWSENNVSDEPNHPDLGDDNGFPHQEFSPQNPTLILDAYIEHQQGFIVGNEEDLDAVRHNVMPGTSHAEGTQHMYPGLVSFEAWWGEWEDRGGGGDFQQNPHTDGVVISNSPNAAIDNANDCEDKDSWDEFHFRATPQQLADAGKQGECGQIEADDDMQAFIHPGTHNLMFNTVQRPIQTTLSDRADDPQVPDFKMQNVVGEDTGFTIWRASSGFGRVMYDSSLVVTTKVTTAVNPKELTTSGDETVYDPFSKEDGKSVHAVDVDVYAPASPAAETLYRTAVWDPSGRNDHRGDNPDVLHDDGAKEWVKEPGEELFWESVRTVSANGSKPLDASEPFVGAADDLVFGVYPHEPDHPNDTHPASLNASYGGFDNYYTVEDQDYSAYQMQETFWLDAKTSLDDLPLWIPACCYDIGPGTAIRPEIPDTSDPFSEDGDHTVGPGILSVNARVGMWHDKNEDTWIGDAYNGSNGYQDSIKGYETTNGYWPPGAQGDDAYDGGTDDDPNDYQDKEEFTPLCQGEAEAISTKIVPTSTPEDPEKDWGAAGVYILGEAGNANPYSNAVMDVGGEEANTATHPLRNNTNTESTAKYLFPEDGKHDGEYRLSRHRTEGPIEMNAWDAAFCENFKGRGDWTNTRLVLVPGGTIDFTFKTVSTWKATKGPDAGMTITDVNHFDSIMSTG